MKNKKRYFILIVLFILLISCTSTNANVVETEGKGTVYINISTDIKAKNENKISESISSLSNLARKDEQAKKDRNALIEVRKNIYNLNSDIGEFVQSNLVSSIQSILESNGYEVIDTDNARYTLTIDFSLRHTRKTSVLVDYTLSVSLFDSQNIPKDFNPDTKLKKYDGKLSDMEHLDTKEYWVPAMWTMNGQLESDTEMIAVAEIMKAIETNLDRSFFKTLFI